MATGQTKVTIQADADSFQISKHIYGHFAEHLGRCVYEGLWVGEASSIPNTRGIRNDVVEALKKLNIPNLRWPGGCYADEYHWRDGIGPRDKRPRTVNSLWGGVVETHEFGTHEFMDLCEMLDCEPYIAGNVGSGTVQEMQEWVQYMTYAGDSDLARERAANGRKEPWKLKFFGVGNENWGCGGAMRPEFYSDQYRQYAEFARNYSGNELYKIACGPNGRDDKWTEVTMERIGHRMHGLSLHYYTTEWNNKGQSVGFDEQAYFKTLALATRMDEIIARHSEVMDQFDPEKRVALVVDEWGTWFDVMPDTNPGFLYQQNTMRDALVTGMTLNIFHKHAERVRIANLAQLVNVLQAPILTDGPKMIVTPTYHVLEMYKVHQDATYLPAEVACPHYSLDKPDLEQLSASASRAQDGNIHISLCNLHHAELLEVTCEVRGASLKQITGQVLEGASIQAMNTFEEPKQVMPAALEGISASGNTIKLTLPAHSVAVLSIES